MTDITQIAAWKELSRGVDPDGVSFSELSVFVFGDEINFRVRHWVNTRQGGRALNDEIDIYELLITRVKNKIYEYLKKQTDHLLMEDAP